ncbi:hypothetical protein SAMN05421837_103980 [Amycolatopsis pretoriensis]|uniref:Uncharacterized protein n=1 Tax=Amycolatopsis pretoriensis TaxID=218821 RepID=A0A1H5QQL3_9PSEU|nr:hypothetical protein [Amycolatopsis pretoriensis]SEF27658.1 hypothetical protein SAMN05421837_103980 [Amycolatopsis pretoriensis]
MSAPDLNPNPDPNAAAAWMAARIEERGWLPQDLAVQHIAKHFGKDLTYTNESGNPAISRKVLAAFRQLTEGTVIWERGAKEWRRRPRDPAARQSD